MGSSGTRRMQLAIFLTVGIAALAAVFLLTTGGLSDADGLRLFTGSGQSRQTAPGALGGAPARQADSVDGFTKKYGDPPDATYGRIRIPSISVNAPISYRAVTGAVMPDPDGPTDVAYYDLSKFPGLGGVPGAGGNAVFGGHVDLRRQIAYAGNVEYQGPAVFWPLDKLRPGDVVEVDYRGGTYKYVAAAVHGGSEERGGGGTGRLGDWETWGHWSLGKWFK